MNVNCWSLSVKHQKRFSELSKTSVNAISCRYMGAQSLAAGRTGSGEASTSAEPSADLNPEIAQHLRRLSKREAVTKLKALQVSSSPQQASNSFNFKRHDMTQHQLQHPCIIVCLYQSQARSLCMTFCITIKRYYCSRRWKLNRLRTKFDDRP